MLINFQNFSYFHVDACDEIGIFTVKYSNASKNFKNENQATKMKNFIQE